MNHPELHVRPSTSKKKPICLVRRARVVQVLASQHLLNILVKHDAGLTNGEHLVCQGGRPPLVSPNATKRQ